MHRCPNQGCPAQFFELLKHFVSRGAMDIDGLGERWCRILIDRGLVSDLSHIYTLTQEQLTELDRMGDKSATRILTNAEASKQRPAGPHPVRPGHPARRRGGCRVAGRSLRQHRRNRGGRG